MIYDANTRVWRVGDVVVHDADAKTVQMLMRVVECQRDGLFRCRYIDREIARGERKRWGTCELVNAMHLLHDPSRFGIDVPLTVAYPPRRRP